MENQEIHLNHQWTKILRKKFNLFIKEKNPTFFECKEFLGNLGIDLMTSILDSLQGSIFLKNMMEGIQ